jgi:HK97 family phage major capsid protein
MRLSRHIVLPGAGISVPVITGDAEASVVGETDEIPVRHSEFTNKMITPFKIAVIDTFSNEFRRDLPNLYSVLLQRLPLALGKKFDSLVLSDSTTLANFDVLGGATKVPIDKDTYGGLVAADTTVASAEWHGELTGWGLSPQARGLLLGAKDTVGNPLIINNVQTDGSVPALLGKPVYYSKALYKYGNPEILGIAGDFTTAVFGTVEGVNISITDQATVTVSGQPVNLWQRKMFAISAEIEVGFAVEDLHNFVLLTTTGTPDPNEN